MGKFMDPAKVEELLWNHVNQTSCIIEIPAPGTGSTPGTEIQPPAPISETGGNPGPLMVPTTPAAQLSRNTRDRLPLRGGGLTHAFSGTTSETCPRCTVP